MLHPDLAAYVEGLPPEDRRTVEQALRGLRRFFAPGFQSAEIVDLLQFLRERDARTA